MNLIVRGESINVPEYVIDRIPYIKTYILSKNEVYDLENNDSDQYQSLEIDSVSPKFISLLIQGIKNENKPSYMKTLFENYFEEEDIKKYLQFLQINDLHNLYYSEIPLEPHKINGRLLIDKILNYISHLVYVLSNNDLVNSRDNNKYFDIRNTIIRIPGEKIMVKNDHNYIGCVPFTRKVYNTDKYYYLVSCDKVIEYNGKYWMNIEDYIVPFIDNQTFEYASELQKIYAKLMKSNNL